jgi:hypothetical protein
MAHEPAYLLVTPSRAVWDLERNAAELSKYLTAGDTSLIQVLELFMNVEPELVLEFAKQHGVPSAALFASYCKICNEGWKPKAKMVSAMESLKQRGGYDESPRHLVRDV